MLLIRRHPDKQQVQEAALKWQKRFLRPPRVYFSRDPISKHWIARSQVR